MRYRLQRHDGTDCSATMVPITVLRMVPIQRYRQFALFLFEENQKKSRQLDEMIARLDEIGKDLKESNRKIDSLTNALLKANSKVEKAAIEYKLRDKEYKKLEKKYNACRRGIHVLIACITSENTASCAFHEALGFRKASSFEEVGMKFGRWLGVTDYQLIL